MPVVAVVDSGGANIASLMFALQRIGRSAEVTADPLRIRTASHVILPGVGTAHDAMTRLRAAGLDVLIPTLTQPVLGICLGMQLLFGSSDEAASAGSCTETLGIVPGRVARMSASPSRPVPHMGWNQVRVRPDSSLFTDIPQDPYFYFVHSFAAPVSEYTVASSEYGTSFCAAVKRDNFYGVQFHPERSSSSGAQLLANFLALKG